MNNKNITNNGYTLINMQVKSAIFGHAIADALGVPVEFQSRESLKKNPVSSMRGYGTYDVPPGSWSDDTSMVVATLDSLSRGLNYTDIMKKFCLWLQEGAYTPFGEVFDIGISTKEALTRYQKGNLNPVTCGGKDAYDNGNGSLMRIIPIALFCKFSKLSFEESMEIIHNASRLTHGHPRSLIACGIFSTIVFNLIDNPTKGSILNGIEKSYRYYESKAFFQEDLKYYQRILDYPQQLPEESDINSSGYVVNTLEASLWCLLTTYDYQSCVLKAVNLGSDTDTVAAIAGGLAGILYGYSSLPEEWLKHLARSSYIEELCDNFSVIF